VRAMIPWGCAPRWSLVARLIRTFSSTRWWLIWPQFCPGDRGGQRSLCLGSHISLGANVHFLRVLDWELWGDTRLDVCVAVSMPFLTTAERSAWVTLGHRSSYVYRALGKDRPSLTLSSWMSSLWEKLVIFWSWRSGSLDN
jgi:hypothetical protein